MPSGLTALPSLFYAGPEVKEEKTDNSHAWPFDAMAADYDAWFEGAGKTVFDIEVRAFQDVLPSLPRPWFEVGVGSGRFAQALGIEMGLDPSIRVAEMAQKRGIAVLLGKAEQLPFADRVLGTLFLIVTFCFVASPRHVLQEAYRVLLPGGRVVLGLVLRDSSLGRLYQEKKRQGHRYYKHATFCSYAEVTRLLEEAGFTVERVISTLFQRPGQVEHLESPKQGFSSDGGFTIIVAGKAGDS
jgi:SAM-dependent methyltransferase